MKIGAWLEKDGKSSFTVWAPFAAGVELNIITPEARKIPMDKKEDGYWRLESAGIPAGAGYMYIVDGKTPRPDPSSFYQPEGVHGRSELVDHDSFKWNDGAWKGIEPGKMIAYELHIGTFTAEGTFDAAINKLDHLKGLGVNAVEVMPVAQFPGRRNWGYDGAYFFAVQNSYGGPEGFKRFVDACHGKGMAIILDVVYNHFGPEGNYIENYGPYFTGKYGTPWGKAVNYDDARCEGVRNFVVRNMECWFKCFHVDALRLDAIHGIYDKGPKHILKELSEEKAVVGKEAGRKFYLIAESDLNDPRVIESFDKGGYGIDVQWLDDFHHCLHTLLTGEKGGYYADFGKTEDLAKCLKNGFVYDGIYSRYRGRNHGGLSAQFGGDRFFVFAQNHDQVGNRMMGERLSALADFESLKLAAGCVILSPYIPMLFMGEEYGESAPFMYFIEHGDKGLVDAVRKGRKKEFEAFAWDREIPDPQSEKTFNDSKLSWDRAEKAPGKILSGFYRKLIGMRKTLAAYGNPDKNTLSAVSPEGSRIIQMTLGTDKDELLCLMNFGDKDAEFKVAAAGSWTKLIDSSDKEWAGSGGTAPGLYNSGGMCLMRARSIVLYGRK
ncbi:MAG: malto-oligosyltrehalose trehalohydrolase [Elusimicrobiota bacterium]